MRALDHPAARGLYLVVLLFTLLAGDAWRYTVGWVGFGVVAGVSACLSVALLVRHRERWRMGGLPYPLLVFLVLTVVSIAWSFYPGPSALGAIATWVTVIAAVAVAVSFDWSEILRGLGIALRIVLGSSLVFEFVVAAFVRAPVLPLVAQPGVDYANLPDPVPKMLFWSRDELFSALDGGKIQGIVGNSALLSFVALLGLVVFAIQLAARRTRRIEAGFWLLVAAACFILSRSATNIVGLVVVVAVAAAVLLIRRAESGRARAVTYAALIAVFAGAAVASFVLRNSIFAALGKSADLTNRGAIWDAVIDLARQRPLFGWGWVGYWAPWAEPFTHLASNGGVRQLHAHNAWLDVWFQLGVLGLIVFGSLVASTLVRSWAFATDRPLSAADRFAAHSPVALVPLAVAVILVVQSVAESRILVEYGLFLLALCAVKTKRGDVVPLRG